MVLLQFKNYIVSTDPSIGLVDDINVIKSHFQTNKLKSSHRKRFSENCVNNPPVLP